MIRIPNAFPTSLAGFFLAVSLGFAEEGEDSANEIAKSLANPNTPLATLNFKNQFRFFRGDLPGAADVFGAEWHQKLLAWCFE